MQAATAKIFRYQDYLLRSPANFREYGIDLPKPKISDRLKFIISNLFSGIPQGIGIIVGGAIGLGNRLYPFNPEVRKQAFTAWQTAVPRCTLIAHIILLPLGCGTWLSMPDVKLSWAYSNYFVMRLLSADTPRPREPILTELQELIAAEDNPEHKQIFLRSLFLILKLPDLRPRFGPIRNNYSLQEALESLIFEGKQSNKESTQIRELCHIFLIRYMRYTQWLKKEGFIEEYWDYCYFFAKRLVEAISSSDDLKTIEANCNTVTDEAQRIVERVNSFDVCLKKIDNKTPIQEYIVHLVDDLKTLTICTWKRKDHRYFDWDISYMQNICTTYEITRDTTQDEDIDPPNFFNTLQSDTEGGRGIIGFLQSISQQMSPESHDWEIVNNLIRAIQPHLLSSVKRANQEKPTE